MILFYDIPDSLNKELPALRTERAFRFVTDIADVYEFQPRIHCGLSGISECFERGRGEIRQFVMGEEPGEMERHIGAEVFDDPLAHFPDIFHVVIQGGDDEVGYLKPYAFLF